MLQSVLLEFLNRLLRIFSAVILQMVTPVAQGGGGKGLKNFPADGNPFLVN